MTTLFYVMLFFFMALCSLICFVILIQESKSMGLGASFGGDVQDSIFGTSTADVLKKFTAYLVLIFMLASLILSFWSSALGRAKSRPSEVMMEETRGEK